MKNVKGSSLCQNMNKPYLKSAQHTSVQIFFYSAQTVADKNATKCKIEFCKSCKIKHTIIVSLSAVHLLKQFNKDWITKYIVGFCMLTLL